MKRPFKCDVCNTRFTRRSNALKHRKVFHGNIDLDLKQPPLQTPKPKMKVTFQCSECDRKYSRKDNLSSHQRRQHKSNFDFKVVNQFECDVIEKKASHRQERLSNQEDNESPNRPPSNICEDKIDGKLITETESSALNKEYKMAECIMGENLSKNALDHNSEEETSFEKPQKNGRFSFGLSCCVM